MNDNALLTINHARPIKTGNSFQVDIGGFLKGSKIDDVFVGPFITWERSYLVRAILLGRGFLPKTVAYVGKTRNPA